MKSAIAYVDDITLLASGNTAKVARRSLQDFIDVISRWSISNCLCLNPTKCTTMCITPTKRKAIVSAKSAMPLHVNGSALNSALIVKILSVVITSDLSWQEQARAMQFKISHKLSVAEDLGHAERQSSCSNLQNVHQAPF